MFDDTSEQAYPEIGGLIMANVQFLECTYQCAATQVQSARECWKSVWDKYQEAVAAEPKLGTTTVMFEFYPTSKITSRPDDATAFNGRGYRNNVLVQVMWDGDTGYVSTARKWMKEIAAQIDSGEGSHETPYGNYGTRPMMSWRELMRAEADPTGSRAKKLWGSNLPRLQKIKAKYDPDLVFNKWFPIEPVK